jgi:16S rRNA (uracil1498-N3)-methyltransferase
MHAATDAKQKIRLYVEAPLAPGGTVEMSPDQAHFLRNVRRLKVGDGVLLFNGRDGEWQASVASLGRGVGQLRIGTRTRAQAGGADVWLLQAAIKRGPLEMVVEKAVELGAARMQLVTTEYSLRRKVNVGRLRAIATEAAEQCGRLDVPTIAEAVTLPRVLDDWPAGRRLVHCDETGTGRPLAEVLRDAGFAGAPAALLIGPEGGFSPAEREALAAAPFATPAALGPRTLRAGTAAIAALTLWQALAGDWRD